MAWLGSPTPALRILLHGKGTGKGGNTAPISVWIHRQRGQFTRQTAENMPLCPMVVNRDPQKGLFGSFEASQGTMSKDQASFGQPTSPIRKAPSSDQSRRRGPTRRFQETTL